MSPLRGDIARMSSAFSAIQYQGKSNSAGHQMDRGRRKQRATHPCVMEYKIDSTLIVDNK